MKIQMNGVDVRAINGLLRRLPVGYRLRRDFKAKTSMDLRRANQMAMVLLAASHDRKLPTELRHNARYWGAYLDQRT